MQTELKVNGLREVEAKLKKLGAEVGVKTLSAALMNASLPAFKRTKSEAPGSISQAVSRVKHRSNKSLKLSKYGRSAGSNQAAGVSIIVRKRKAPHAHLIHDGTKRRYTKGKGKKKSYKNAYRGKVKPNRWMLKAWEAEGEQKAVDRFSLNVKKRVLKLTK